MSPKFSLVCILLYYFWTSVVLSQSTFTEQLKTYEHPLLTNLNYDEATPPVFEDSRGYIWIGTFTGLIKFDGYKQIVYSSDPQDSTTLTDNKIDCLAEDKNQNLWVGTQNGLNYFDSRKSTFKRYTGRFKYSMDDVSNPRIYDIKINEKNDILVKASNGMYLYNREQDEFVLIKLGFSIDNTSKFILYTSQFLYLSIYNTIYKLKIKNERMILLDSISIEENKEVRISSEYPLSSSYILIGSNVGVYKLEDHGKLKIEKLINPFGRDPVLSITRKDQTNVFIGTPKTLYEYDLVNQKVKCYQSNKNIGKQSLFYQNTYTSNQILWHKHPKIHTSDLKHLQFKSVYLGKDWSTIAPGLLFEPHEWSKNKLLISSPDGLKIAHTDTKRLEDFPFRPAFNLKSWANGVTTVFKQDSNLLWIGACGGIFLFNKVSSRFIDITLKYPSLLNMESNKDCIRKLYCNESKTLWIAMWSTGLYKLDLISGELKPYSFKGQWQNNFRTIFKDKKGDLWFGTRGGLFKYIESADSFKVYKNKVDDPNTLSENTSFSLYEDKQDHLWVGTYGGGINLFNSTKDSIKRYTVNDGLMDNSIFAMYPDSKDNLWIKNFKGLSYFDKQKNEFTNYNSKNGLINEAFVAFSHYQSERTGELFFIGNTGIDYFHPDSIKRSTYSPPIYITNLKIFNKDVAIGRNEKDKVFKLKEDITFTKEIKLSYTQSVITFDYAALDYSAPENIHYTYKLENFDKEWQFVKNQRSITYTNLHPGHYTFQVKATNADGIWGNQMATLQLIITPPWWRTWWAYTLYFIGFFACITGYVQYRSYALTKKNKLLEVLVEERTAALKSIQDQLILAERENAEQEKMLLKKEASELEMQALRAQMNPHFIFNALNSINNFIQQNDKKQASDYLIKFSKLVRSVLEFTRLKDISLQQELETLNLYIQLEALRFKQKFEYQIKIPEEMDVRSLKVPPLILQPFVENAIYHGLMPKNSDGQLFIVVNEFEKYLQISIKDNGVGRKTSASKKQPTLGTHKSMGIDLTIDRIRLFNKDSFIDFQPVLFCDLMDESNNGIGTEVFINLNITI